MLDIEQSDQLLAYLQANQWIHAGERPVIRLLDGGVSNRTVMVQRENGEGWVIKQALEKLRVAVDWFSSPERVEREALGLRYVGKLCPTGAVPRLIFEDLDLHIVAMQAIPQPHQNYKHRLLDGHVENEYVMQFASLLAIIQQKSAENHSELRPIFADRSFFETLRIEPYYAYTGEQVPPAHQFIQDLIAQTRATALTLVHGDYSPKNVLIYQNQLVLLDYEVIHWGDPAFDVGFSMTHYLSKANHHQDKTVRQAFLQAARLYWDTYFSAVKNAPWADRLEVRCVQHTLACLLARVAGRSPLEYLTPATRQKQRDMVISLIADMPLTMPILIEQISILLDSHPSH